MPETNGKDMHTDKILPSGINLYGDNAYSDEHFKGHLKEQQIKLLTPIKKPKKKKLTIEQKRLNRMVSKIRQSIESFFKWLIDKFEYNYYL